jgi:predicted ATP-dependent serine protease
MYAAQAFRCIHCRQDATFAREVCPSCGGYQTMMPYKPQGRSEGPEHARAIRGGRFGRVKSGLVALDRALGGGFVVPSVVLVWGPAGSKKTTRAARIVDAVASARHGTALYASSEVPSWMVRRLAENDGTRLRSSWLWHVTSMSDVALEARLRKPVALCLDSAQHFEYGSERHTEAALLGTMTEAVNLRDRLSCLVLVVSQVNSDGEPAGSRRILHLSDVEIRMRVDGATVVKNRFAPSPREAKL